MEIYKRPRTYTVGKEVCTCSCLYTKLQVKIMYTHSTYKTSHIYTHLYTKLSLQSVNLKSLKFSNCLYEVWFWSFFIDCWRFKFMSSTTFLTQRHSCVDYGGWKGSKWTNRNRNSSGRRMRNASWPLTSSLPDVWSISLRSKVTLGQVDVSDCQQMWGEDSSDWGLPIGEEQEEEYRWGDGEEA